MPYLLLLLLFVAGCASPGRELQRGTPVRPPPPPVRPGHGAPVVGQPGQQSPELPRSPHRRPLPPTREPGLWAGDGPQASKGAVPKPVLLGVELPFPPDATSDDDTYPVRLCGQALSAAVAHLEIIPHGPRLPAGASRECAAAALLLQCLNEDADELARQKAKGSKADAALRDAYRQSVDMARNFFSAKCGKRSTPKPEIDYYDHVLTEWRTLKRNVQ